jgi:hypothetical protein
VQLFDGLGKEMKNIVVPLVILLALGGCGGITLSPVTNEDRAVSPLTAQTRAVLFKESMVWYDQGPAPTRGVKLPEGAYVLEAEDTDYRYFHAPSQIEYRRFQNGNVTDARFFDGGLALSKSSLGLNAASVYQSGDASNKALVKILIWKLGGDFLKMEGSKWTKNF